MQLLDCNKCPIMSRLVLMGLPASQPAGVISVKVSHHTNYREITTYNLQSARHS